MIQDFRGNEIKLGDKLLWDTKVFSFQYNKDDRTPGDAWCIGRVISIRHSAEEAEQRMEVVVEEISPKGEKQWGTSVKLGEIIVCLEGKQMWQIISSPDWWDVWTRD